LNTPFAPSFYAASVNLHGAEFCAASLRNLMGISNASLPDWVLDQVKLLGRKIPSMKGRMNLAIDLAARNVANKTGGLWRKNAFLIIPRAS
jgi:hypothetical protein